MSNSGNQSQQADQSTNQSAGQSSHSPDIELNLSDAHYRLGFVYGDDQMNMSSQDVEIKNQLTAEAHQLPSLLIDEQLLAEINLIPDRFGFKIGDVADLLGIKQYVLRYWEQEFDELKPKKSSNNHRFFSKKDVEMAFLIRKLLHRDRFSIEGARQALKDVKSALKKEKNFNNLAEKYNKKTSTTQEQLQNLIVEIHKVKQLFE